MGCWAGCLGSGGGLGGAWGAGQIAWVQGVGWGGMGCWAGCLGSGVGWGGHGVLGRLPVFSSMTHEAVA